MEIGDKPAERPSESEKRQIEEDKNGQFYCKVVLTESMTANAIKSHIREAKLFENSYLKIVTIYLNRNKSILTLVSKTADSNEKLITELKKIGCQISDENPDETSEKWCIYRY